jgi:hypothetical protein
MFNLAKVNVLKICVSTRALRNQITMMFGTDAGHTDLIFPDIVPRNNHLPFCRGTVPVLETENVFFTVSCQYGWEYDRTWYSQTAASQEDWVCSKELQIPNTLFFSKVGEVLGEVFIGQLGDT